MLDRRTILLVEDSEDDVFFMRGAFQRARVTNPLQIVTDGDEAVAYLDGHGPYRDRERFPTPFAVFLDLNLPKRSGLEVLEWIRHQSRLRALSVHILSASSRAADVERAAVLGANSYLVKPSRLDDLVSLVSAWSTLQSFTAHPVLDGNS